VRELAADSQYEIIAALPASTIGLTVYLPPTFPHVPPALLVRPPVRHAWIDERGYIVNFDKLVNWNQHVSLGKLVKDILVEFSIRPPLVHPNASPPRANQSL
jgi:ubiquitin-protein ligase